ncbi:hypothetical protein ASPACDRAFT_1855928 [Aspergillus aculeatus ATCC 16872]|uniref:Zn(2)-C6 fungal-type domain-containing protein n=1 Tax=Aspergillus aculeatus (strain ATCC 16872 / CBS 172.66 / WB 5094) TaxID=690307 RepID=A0A1L9WW43_ASPA1|nr:uncharacterized protein ASPACDRAFT_1855928 [Aspergillus aculeatus ATCC 16872]OJK00353.1 hypothetical protein ASPACDRAFT_1855928 [Aspergillus aculeatus ATCC 16872]
MGGSDSSPNSAPKLVMPRKSHRKSRNGCRTCKSRHVKCDEMKPECSNCLNHSVQCMYGPSLKDAQPAVANTRKTSRARAEPPGINTFKIQFVEFNYVNVSAAPAAPAARPAEENREPVSTDPAFCLEDFELQHFFLSSTCLSLMEDAPSLTFWQSVVPRTAFRFPIVHHLMLALACLHMIRSTEQEHHHNRNCCPLRFDYHYGTGLQLLSNGLSQPQALANANHGADAVGIGSILVCFISLARGPRAEEYLFFNRGGAAAPVEWLTLLRGVNTISTMLRKGRAAAASSEEQQQHQNLSESQGHPFQTPAAAGTPCTGYQEALTRVCEFTEERAAADPLLPTYRMAIEHTLRAFQMAFPGRTEDDHLISGLVAATATRPEPFAFVLFTWVTQMEELFWDALQEKRPVALVILAHFVVLMYRMDKTWVSHGWPEHILRGIWTFLGKDDRVWVRWPIDEIRIVDL